MLPVFFGRLVLRPQEELERICAFIGDRGRVHWDTSLRPQNVGRERLRKKRLREMLVQAPQLTAIRRRLAPKLLTEHIKAHWRIKGERIDVSPELRDRLCDRFNPDLERLGSWLDVPLDCANFSGLRPRPGPSTGRSLMAAGVKCIGAHVHLSPGLSPASSAGYPVVVEFHCLPA